MNLLSMGALIEAASETSQQPATGQTGAPGNNSMMIWVLFGVMIIAFYVMQRRAKKRQGDANAFRSELGPGQRVMTASGMIGVISRVDGDIITVMSASGDESAWVRRAIGKLVSDDEWEAMTAEYPDVLDEDAGVEPSELSPSEEDPSTPPAITENRPATDNPEKDS